MHGDANSGEHERFRELAAAATCGALSAEERELLDRHLRECEECLSAFHEYQVLANEGATLLAGGYEHREASGNWNEAAARRKLMARVEGGGVPRLVALVPPSRRVPARKVAAAAALAASLLAGVGIGAWRFSNWQGNPAASAGGSANSRIAELLTARQSVETELRAEAAGLDRLQQDDSAKRRALDELQRRYQDLQVRLQAAHTDAETAKQNLSQANAAAEMQLSQVTQQRDQLSEQLRNAHQDYDLVEKELTNLRAEHDRARVRLASLETRIGELATVNQEQEKRLKEDEQYLASDRDIRDLMSARNLYIADVFDVDSRSRTRKPFGRVFLTRGKSLLFYAYDLDQQAQLKDAGIFQVWGQKETDRSQPIRPMNLGVLYLDNEANRRWFMRFDDPQTLAKIDAVFVTVEPRGGSRKPTGKPFLFASLRMDANHP